MLYTKIIARREAPSTNEQRPLCGLCECGQEVFTTALREQAKRASYEYTRTICTIAHVYFIHINKYSAHAC